MSQFVISTTAWYDKVKISTISHCNDIRQINSGLNSSCLSIQSSMFKYFLSKLIFKHHKRRSHEISLLKIRLYTLLDTSLFTYENRATSNHQEKQLSAKYIVGFIIYIINRNLMVK